MSHSSGWILHAITLDNEVGIDVEMIRSDLPLDDVSKIVFTPAEERLVLQRPPGREQQRAFFQGWTCKEALLKGIGEGFSEKVKMVEIVSSSSNEPMIKADQFPFLNSCWSVLGLDLGEEFAAALAVNRKDLSFRFYDFSVNRRSSS
jgi:4'-phosphopantetheinyl transferase